MEIKNDFLVSVAHFLSYDIEWNSIFGENGCEFWAYVPFGQLKPFADAFCFDDLDSESLGRIKIEIRSTYVVINISDCLKLFGFEDTDLFIKNACWTDRVRFSSKII